MQHVQGEIKEILAACTGTPTQKLIAILAAAGITATAELSDLVGVSDRAIRKAKAEPQFLGTTVPPRNYSSAQLGTTVPQPGTTVPPLARADVFNNNPLTKTTSAEKTRTHAREGFAGRFIQLTPDDVAELAAAFAKLSFPGDLMAADAYLARQIAGKIEFSSPDDRKTSLVTYLAKRNRETSERQQVAKPASNVYDMTGGVPFRLDPATPRNLKPRLTPTTGAANA